MMKKVENVEKTGLKWLANNSADLSSLRATRSPKDISGGRLAHFHFVAEYNQKHLGSDLGILAFHLVIVLTSVVLDELVIDKDILSLVYR